MHETRTEKLRRETLSHLDGLFGTALHLTGNRQDAEDLVQDTYLRAMRGLDEYRGDALSKPWLYRILRNAHIDGYRRRSRRPTTVPLEESPEPPDRDVAGYAVRFTREAMHLRGEVDRVLHETVSDDVKRAIDGLTDPFRLTLVLRDLVGFTYGETAEMLEVPIGTVMSRLHRARASVRDRLQAIRSPGRSDSPIAAVEVG